ncbi:prepilin peptidase [Methanobrevibacter sp. DSM 116169]|uniref:A24 family peptidase n=1 Tax=Methanobrevibacter sp. DSM 116169 TaxID=3242727 RepID=UPI0038FC8DA3
MYYNSVFIFPTIISFLFILIASYNDFKKGIIPNKLNFSFLFCGLFINLIFSIFFNDVIFIASSIIFTFITFCVSYIAWKFKIWGGGDVKLFTAISSAIPFPINLSFLTGFSPEIGIFPFFIIVMLNSILCSFPILIIILIYNLNEDSNFYISKNNIAIFLNFKYLHFLIKESFNKTINIKDLSEGMVLNNYYFNDSRINEIINENSGNLSSYTDNNNDKFKYYLKSNSIAGIDSSDLVILKILHDKKLINNNFSIKQSFPFAPSILAGFTIAIIFGDLTLIITKSIKMVLNVII